jgi:hypothetical protein
MKLINKPEGFPLQDIISRKGLMSFNMFGVVY